MTVETRGDPAKGTQYFEARCAVLVPIDISRGSHPGGADWDVAVHPKGEDGSLLPGRGRQFILSHHGVTASDPQSAAEVAARLAGLLP